MNNVVFKTFHDFVVFRQKSCAGKMDLGIKEIRGPNKMKFGWAGTQICRTVVFNPAV